MSEKVKRSWGKGRQREEVTIINREKIEETLQTLVEEAKKCKTASNSSNKATTGTRTDEMDLQYPELMSDESLVTALKRIKVPIPVYPNGRPSRERLLHLYRTNILPRPQRNRRKRRRVSGVSQEDDQGGSAMEVEVEYHSEWDANSSESSNTQLQRKRWGVVYNDCILLSQHNTISHVENVPVWVAQSRRKAFLLLRSYRLILRCLPWTLLLPLLAPPTPSEPWSWMTGAWALQCIELCVWRDQQIPVPVPRCWRDQQAPVLVTHLHWSQTLPAPVVLSQSIRFVLTQHKKYAGQKLCGHSPIGYIFFCSTIPDMHYRLSIKQTCEKQNRPFLHSYNLYMYHCCLWY